MLNRKDGKKYLLYVDKSIGAAELAAAYKVPLDECVIVGTIESAHYDNIMQLQPLRPKPDGDYSKCLQIQ